MTPFQPGDRPDDDDILDDLPPMDGDDDDGDDETRGAFDEAELEPMDEEESHEDDGQSQADLPVGELVDALPDAIEPDEEEASALETGDGGIGFTDETANRPDDDDESGVAGDDLSIGIAEMKEIGDEDTEQLGVGEPIEDEVDEAEFPELDSDEEADLPGGLDVGELELPEEAPLPAWSDARWERNVTPLIAVPMRCVVVREEHVVAGGDGALRMAPDGNGNLACTWLPLEQITEAEVMAVAVDARAPERLVLATRHAVLVSNDGGRSVRPMSLSRAVGSGTSLCTLVTSATAPLAYASTSIGDLFASADRGETWRAIEGIGNVRALAMDERGTVHVVALQDEEVIWLRADEQAQWCSTQLELDAIGVDEQRTMFLAARRDVVVLADESGTIAVSRDAGGSWTGLRVPSQIVALAILPSGEIVCAVYLESEDKSVLVRVDAGDGLACVADLSPNVSADGDGDPSEGMGQACALAWDEGRGCLWVAGRFGLSAWRASLPA
jgi:hypothetical protein